MINYKRYFQRGITIQEILLVVAIFIVILSMALPAFRDSRDRQLLKSVTLEVYSVVTEARSQSLASLDSSEYGVHFESDKVVIFKGQSYSSSNLDNEDTEIPSSASISVIDLTGGATDVYFDRLSGAPSVIGTVTIAVATFTRTLTISATGIVSVD